MSILLSRGRFYKQWLFDRGPQFYRINLRNTNVGASAVVPAGFGFTRAACIDSVQTGTESLVEIASQANILRYGRASDAWDLGLVLEEARTQRVASSKDYSHVSFLAVGTTNIVSTTELAPTLTNVASRITAAAGSNSKYHSVTGLAAGSLQSISQWMRPFSPPADVALTGAGTVASDILLSAPAEWRRYQVVVTIEGSGVLNTLVVDSRGAAQGIPGIANGARDWVVYAVQVESGAFQTEYIPSTTATVTRNATFLRALSATWSPWLNNGRFSIEYSFRAKGARTAYSTTSNFWYIDVNNYASFVPSTGVLTILVGGATNTVTLPSWAKFDLIDLSIQCGGNRPTVVQYKLNNGSTVSLAVTGAVLGNMTGGTDMYLMSSNAGSILSCWLYEVNFYRLGKPSWVTA